MIRLPLLKYPASFLFISAALTIQLLLDPILGKGTPFLFFFGAVMLSAWHGGLGPGVLATLLGAVLANFFFITPDRSFGSFLTVEGFVRTAVFSMEGVLMSLLFHALRSTREQKSAALQALEQNRRTVRESEENYRRLVEGTRDYAIFLLDPKGIVKSWNRGAERIKGYRAEEIIGKHFSTFYPEEDKAWDKPGYELKKVIEEGRFEDEGWRLRKDGSRFWANVIITSLQDEEGKLIGFSKITRDLTERKRAEEEIRRLNMELEQKVIDRTAALEAANKELEAFSYSVSHDLRAPLRSVNGFSQVLLEDYADRLDEEGKSTIERIRAATQRMGQLIDDLLKLSRMTRGEVRREKVDLSRMVKEIAEELRKREPERSATFDIPEGLWVSADPQLIHAVLVNLIENAWKFTRNKSDAHIAFGQSEKEGVKVYYIKDNGAGFDMTYVNKLFTPFQRLHTPKEFEGTGIGLATVQRIIRRHGGEVWAEGKVGEGATFYFSLQPRGKNE
ncbi:MAG: PAS domain S-box protein [Candidatus Manganitrophus sp.]|nr:PAS domain S-box protein [Candidatus Manganitrophus sp.]WDT81201.1 MAG: PAS domain S-box protein [Candidatus Manganitrophus sp.]